MERICKQDIDNIKRYEWTYIYLKPLFEIIIIIIIIIITIIKIMIMIIFLYQ